MTTCKDCMKYKSGRCAKSDDDNEICDKFTEKVEKMTKMLDGYEVKSCPFCGKIDSVDFANLKEEEDCEAFENEDKCPAYKSCSVCNGFYVVCSVAKGGCGGHSGFSWDKDNAVGKWNRRAKGGDAE